MIHIENEQIVPENPNLRVLSPTGDYDDNDFIECYDINNPGIALAAFPSQFIKYGGVVYKYSNPEELGKELLIIDPACTHNAAIYFKEEEARRIKREKGDFTPENPVPADESISPIAQEAVREESPAVEETNVESKNTNANANTNANTNTANNGSSSSNSEHRESLDSGVLVASPNTEATSTPTETSTSTTPIINSSTGTNTTSTSPYIEDSGSSSSANSSTSSPAAISSAGTNDSVISNVVETISTTAEKISDVIDTIIDISTGSSTPN